MTVPPSPARTRSWRVFTVHDARVILVGLGILTLLVGFTVLVNDVPARQYPAILMWLVMVLVAHDVVIAGAVFALSVAGRRAEGRFSHRSILTVQAALVIGGLMSLLVAPAIAKKAIGTANPSVLPLDYAQNLSILLLALIAAAVAAIALHAVLDRRRRAR